MEDNTVKDWLNTKFLEWERTQKRKSTLREFALWLNVSEKTLGHWMNGNREPNGENVNRIAAKLGPEIYDLLGLARPDPIIRTLTDHVDSLPASVRERLLALVANGASTFDVMLQTFVEFLKDESTGFPPLAEDTALPTITVNDLKSRSFTEVITWSLQLPPAERRQLIRLALSIISGNEP